MVVSVVALTITGFLSFNYADQILKQRTGDQLFGESTVRGETLRLLFESRIEQNQILANDPMIQFLITEMNEVPEMQLKSIKEEKRRDYLIQVQAFQELIGFSIGFVSWYAFEKADAAFLNYMAVGLMSLVFAGVGAAYAIFGLGRTVARRSS